MSKMFLSVPLSESLAVFFVEEAGLTVSWVTDGQSNSAGFLLPAPPKVSDRGAIPAESELK